VIAVAETGITRLDAVNVSRLLLDISVDDRSPRRVRKGARSFASTVQPGMSSADLGPLIRFLQQVSAHRGVPVTDREAAQAWAMHLSD
jgi:uncharacterized protein (UPF0147 family)